MNFPTGPAAKRSDGILTARKPALVLWRARSGRRAPLGFRLLTAAGLLSALIVVTQPAPAAAQNLTIPQPEVGVTQGSNSDAVKQGPKPPPLMINIPLLEFTNATSKEIGGTVTSITVPWIAQYVAGVYRYAVAVAGVLAAAMMMIGGIKYLTAGGDAGRISAAKGNISNALLGLSLVFVSYLLTLAINPDMTTYQGLQVDVVARQKFAYNELQYTLAETGGGIPEGNLSSVGGPSPGGVAPPAGSSANVYSSCPLNLTAPVDNDTDPRKNLRAIEFYNQAGTIATAGTTAQRVVQLGSAAAACQTYFGSCGRTAGTLFTLAGAGSSGNQRTKKFNNIKLIPGTDCLFDTGGCWTHEKSAQLKSVPQSYIDKIHTYKCKNDCKDPTSPRKPDNPGCKSSRDLALQELEKELVQGIGGGYPGSWADLLQPGDALWIYNGWAGCTGLHSIVFVGWGKKKGEAQIVQGMNGKPTRSGSVCLTPDCKLWQPIIKIFRVRQ